MSPPRACPGSPSLCSVTSTPRSKRSVMSPSHAAKQEEYRMRKAAGREVKRLQRIKEVLFLIAKPCSRNHLTNQIAAGQRPAPHRHPIGQRGGNRSHLNMRLISDPVNACRWHSRHFNKVLSGTTSEVRPLLSYTGEEAILTLVLSKVLKGSLL